MTTGDGDDTTQQSAPPHPYLSKPLLYITGLDPRVDDRELASDVFAHCLPVRLNISRDVPPGQLASGTVEFQSLDKAELALATIHSLPLRIAAPSQKEPQPAAKPRLIKQLPPLTDDVAIYNMFRPYGAVAKAKCIETNLQGHHIGFKGMANVVFYSEEDAVKAQNDLHCTEMAGKLISVAPDAIRRPSASDNAYGSKLSARAPTFVPTFTPAQGQEATTATALPGAIDPCNLFIKNLCPSIDNSELFALFKPFGHITSARVMRDDNGKSREFGFVSFTTPESAANALRSLDGQQAGSKNMTVRVHEPKSFREQKLARIFSGDSNSSRGSPASPRSPISPHATNKGSYFSSSSPRNTTAAAAASGDTSTSSTADTSIGSTTSGAFDEIELSRMEPADRDDIIMTEFIKRARELPESNDADVLTVVRGLVECTLTDQIRALNDQRTFERLAGQVKKGMAGEKEVKEKDDAKTPKPATAKLPAEDAPAAADGKEAKISPEPPKNGAASSPATDAAAASASSSQKTERERLGEAVAKLLPEASSSSVNDIAELLAGLPKKERAMALFNGDYLKTKVDEAKAILEMAGDDDEKVADAKKNGAQSTAGKEAASVSPTTAPAASEPAPSAPAAAQPSSSPTPSQTQPHTLSTLALLPCSQIVSLATSPAPPSPLPAINPTIWRQTDEMMDRILAEKREAEQKQKLGDVLFKKIKSFGIKGAPKVTIKLLDEEDLRSLAHVAESFEGVLREKVTGLVEGMRKV